MKVLILSWEYPPRSIGDMSTHVYNLSQGLSKMGNDVYVVTCSNGDAASVEEDNGVKVFRVEPVNISTNNFTDWINHLNYAMVEQCLKLINEGNKFDIIHANDWSVAFAARVIKETYNLPLVTTIHSTEYGRNYGLYTDMQKYISSIEGFLINQSNKVVCRENSMKEQVLSLFVVEEAKLAVIADDSVSEDKEVNESVAATAALYEEFVPKKKKAPAKKTAKKVVETVEAAELVQEVEPIKEEKKVKKTTRKKTAANTAE